jgi:hypothetical protein
LQLEFKIFQVFVFVPVYLSSRNLQAFANGIVAGFVGDDDVSTFDKGRNHTGCRDKSIRINDAALSTEKGGNPGFRFEMDVLRAIEVRSATRTYAILAKSLNGLLFDDLVTGKAVKICRGQVDDRATIGQFAFGSR